MKLYYAAASPFVRKVLIAATELNFIDDIELVEQLVAPGKENKLFENQINPLRKIPALELKDGAVIVDSTAICEFFNDLDSSGILIPHDKAACHRVRTGHSIANGIMESAVLIRYETFLRPEEHRWPVWITEQQSKIDAALQWFTARELGPMHTIEDIALACALGYLDFRQPDFNWREHYPVLALWHKQISAMESYKNTPPQ